MGLNGDMWERNKAHFMVIKNWLNGETAGKLNGILTIVSLTKQHKLKFKKKPFGLSIGNLYEVTRLLSMVQQNYKKYYLVKWRNYNRKYCTWVEEKDITGKHLIPEFRQKWNDAEKREEMRKYALIVETEMLEWQSRNKPDEGIPSIPNWELRRRRYHDSWTRGWLENDMQFTEEQIEEGHETAKLIYKTRTYKNWKQVRILEASRRGRGFMYRFYRVCVFVDCRKRKITRFGCGKSKDRKEWKNECNKQICKHVLAAYCFYCKDFQMTKADKLKLLQEEEEKKQSI